MTVLVREFRPEDAAATVDVLRAAIPFLVTTEQEIVWAVAHANPASAHRLLVAEIDGRLVGRAQVGLAYESGTPGQAYANVYVHPDHRGQGAGSLLLRTAEEHLACAGASSVYSWVLDASANRCFAERRGYQARRSARFLRLDLAADTLPPPPEIPAGVELRTAADFAGDPRPLFALDAATTADEPSDIGAELDDYEDWLTTTWGHPGLDRDLTVVAVVDGTPAAFTAARTDRVSRYSSGMTGVLRAHRGRGLAKLVKAHSLHRARAAGLTEAFTGNDAENLPMLAVNKWFGYEICATEVRHVRELGID
ncbi:GNAT family N-acetyltransferase [Streptomyces cavernicola]|uniref:GNAT family N-acetyltransferase n=1 Tax=Streptomyces cavernicola TaxID=3043613 RepID=A0ABT6SGE6_9ACTN|nr:GNAT family N-acetyltransferase [Streptomyces sp. B-S-A6]MDI3407281.1 GNAT family N-acetyltransferase [Streptomyces sp. B-S-A6]